MRILFWSGTFWPRIGGVENLAAKLLPALRERGYEFIVVTWDNTKVPDEIRFQNIPIYRFPFFAGGDQGSLDPLMKILHQVAKLKREFRPDLVHVNSFSRSALFHLATVNAHPAPMLITLHQALRDEPVGPETILGRLLRAASWVTACSASVVVQMRELVPAIVPRSSLIYNGVQAPVFEPQPMSFNPPRLLCLGRLAAEKGFDLALTAFATVLERYPRARLVIAGDGAERDSLKRQTIELGLVSSVEFVGGVEPEAVAHLIDRSTLVLIPSRLEAFGLVALEAALMARPVVATRVGGLREVVVHQETGLLTECENSRALAHAIESLLEQPEKASRMGRMARKRARKEFDWERHVDSYDALYRKLIMCKCS